MTDTDLINNQNQSKGRGGRRPGAGRRPGSKNLRTLEIEAAAKRHAPDALRTLAWLVDHAKTESVQLAASVALLDRAFGRPRQALEHSSDSPIQLHLAALQAVNATHGTTSNPQK
jgi:hypothetical protein